MKRLALICMFFIFRVDINAQDIPLDTTIYTFTVKPVQKQYITPCGIIATKAAFKYEVLTSNYKFPLHNILIVHWCGGYLRTDKIYTIITRVYNKEDGGIFSNHNKGEFYMFEALHVIQNL